MNDKKNTLHSRLKCLAELFNKVSDYDKILTHLISKDLKDRKKFYKLMDDNDFKKDKDNYNEFFNIFLINKKKYIETKKKFYDLNPVKVTDDLYLIAKNELEVNETSKEIEKNMKTLSEHYSDGLYSKYEPFYDELVEILTKNSEWF